jgi:hypothetical protein
VTTHRTWPADRFYWIVLDTHGVTRAGALPALLLPMLEEAAPADTTTMHAACVPLTDGRLAVCAIDRSELESIPSETLSLTPDSLPPFVDSLGVSRDQFNLLVGEFEPRPIRAARIRRHAFAAATLLLCGVLITIGLHRRASHWNEAAKTAREHATQLAVTAFKSERLDDLANEAARLRETQDIFTRTKPPPDASLILAHVLNAWPANVPSKPQSISIGDAGVSISLSIEGDATAFLQAFTPPKGWTLDEPRLNTVDNITRLALQLRPTGSPQ